MKTQKYVYTITLSVLALAFLTSCGTKNSNETNQESTRINISSEKPFASCNQSTSSSLTFNVATVIDKATNKANANLVKIKFSFLSPDITQTGYTLKFFKWRVINSTAQLEQNPLSFVAYAISNSEQIVSESMTAVYSSQVNSKYGFYIHLNDDVNNPYQVLKVVAYKSDGTILAQSDVLIPEFSASPLDYKTNSDGSVRAENLQQLHPLFSTDVSKWPLSQLKQNFEQYCF